MLSAKGADSQPVSVSLNVRAAIMAVLLYKNRLHEDWRELCHYIMLMIPLVVIILSDGEGYKAAQALHELADICEKLAFRAKTDAAFWDDSLPVLYADAEER